MRRAALALAAALSLATDGSAAAQSAAQPPTTIRIALSTTTYSYLPIFIAIDKGYFADERLDLQVKKFNGSSTTQMPLVARGDLDITPMVASPALFNQQSQGFAIKLIASINETHSGWNDVTWLMVRKDLWDSGAVHSVADLRGHAVDGGPEGSPANFLTREALAKAGLTLSDVKYQARLKTSADWIAALRNKAIDALSGPEPVATQMMLQGLAAKLASPATVMPWFQEAFLIISPAFLQKDRTAAIGFLKAVLRGCQEITAGGPTWTPDEVRVLAHWTDMAPEDIQKIKSPAYCGEYGTINEESLARQQDFWAQLGLVQNRVATASLVDASLVTEARAALGIK